MLQNRPPIIVILGHVDHGKTTLLDYLRQSHIAAREAGGITQHIRSFQLTLPTGEALTFIDTPGHSAFSQMRSRGSQVADIAILVVASDDGVMPQTKESINFISQSHLPFVVALTKSDLPTANPDLAKTQLTEAGVVVEDFGGDVPCVSVSSKTGAGIPDLLEIINLLSSLNPPQADPDGPVELLVLESRLDPKKGPLATVIVKNGTLQVGQPLFISQPLGKALSFSDSAGQSIRQALPSQPVEIFGLSQVPPVGSLLTSQLQSSSAPLASAPSVSASVPGKLNLLLRCDVAGSLEAILASLDPLANVLSAATGDVTESDILLARTSHAEIIGFNIHLSSSVSKLAEVEQVPVRNFKIIYELLEYLHTRLHPPVTETIVGRAQVLAEFKIEGERVAGCRCLDGQLVSSATVRLQRGNQVVGVARLKSLRQGKNTVEKIKSGQEFGAILSPYLDFKLGDTIIAFTQSHGST